ncbi:hypothetical protein [Xanthomonas phage Xp15]|uniref:Uncharacterized protein n=1 Tax=Xanthomonas phage Xp15 TaxID=322855 RepID=Q52PS7_9CAUD|nr:hypothetical protein XPXV15_gp84 [Xanthomonas phage Xp15]AAX84926.1 hypothetical protein [Xanthomonas phage Xp15]
MEPLFMRERKVDTIAPHCEVDTIAPHCEVDTLHMYANQWR